MKVSGNGGGGAVASGPSTKRGVAGFSSQGFHHHQHKHDDFTFDYDDFEEGSSSSSEQQPRSRHQPHQPPVKSESTGEKKINLEFVYMESHGSGNTIIQHDTCYLCL